jgi:hypothetical protein
MASTTRWRAVDEFVAESLVIPLPMVMLDELGDRPAEMTFTERDDPAQTFVLDGPYEALRVRVRVGRLKRRLHHSDPRLTQAFADGRAPLRIPVADQHAVTGECAIAGGRQRASDLAMNASSGCGVLPRICTRREARSITNTV